MPFPDNVNTFEKKISEKASCIPKVSIAQGFQVILLYQASVIHTDHAVGQHIADAFRFPERVEKSA